MRRVFPRALLLQPRPEGIAGSHCGLQRRLFCLQVGAAAKRLRFGRPQLRPGGLQAVEQLTEDRQLGHASRRGTRHEARQSTTRKTEIDETEIQD